MNGIVVGVEMIKERIFIIFLVLFSIFIVVPYGNTWQDTIMVILLFLGLGFGCDYLFKDVWKKE